MEQKRRKYSPEEKLSILQECEREGTLETCRKYSLSPSLVGYWKKKYLKQGVAGLKPSYRKADPAVRSLQEENDRLKRIVAKQALELEVKTELLKYAPIEYRKKKS